MVNSLYCVYTTCIRAYCSVCIIQQGTRVGIMYIFTYIAGVLAGVESIIGPGLRAAVARLLKPNEIGK